MPFSAAALTVSELVSVLASDVLPWATCEPAPADWFCGEDRWPGAGKGWHHASPGFADGRHGGFVCLIRLVMERGSQALARIDQCVDVYRLIRERSSYWDRFAPERFHT